MGIASDELNAIENGILTDIDGQVLLNISSFFHMDTDTLVEKKLRKSL